MAELGVAYIAVTAETSQLAPAVRSAFDGPVSQAAAAAGPGIGQRLSAGIGTGLKAGAIAAGGVAGAALGAALTKGLGRLTAIDDAQAKLRGLGHTSEEVGLIMENALAAVEGTSFGLGEAASVAASAVAAGIEPGKELERTLTLIADAAAIAGVDMGEMGLIFNQVAASGNLMGDEIAQLGERGIPILKFLGDELGVTAKEAKDMASEGKISFETFRNAMERGLGGAAKEMGQSVSGAFKNMNAALGRFGAALLSPGFSQAPGILADLTAGIDKMTRSVSDNLPSALKSLSEFGQRISEGFQDLSGSDFATESVSRLGAVFDSLVSSAKAVAPGLKQIASSLAEAAGAIGVSTWQIFLSALEAGAGIVQALVGPLNALGGLLQSHQGLVNAAAIAWAAFKVVPGILGNLRTGMASVNAEGARTTGVMQGVGAAFGRVQGGVQSLTSGLSSARGGITNFTSSWRDSVRWMQQANPALSTAGAQIRTLGSAASSAASGGLNALRSAGRGIVDAFGGPWGAALAGAAIAAAAVASSSANTAAQLRAVEGVSKTAAQSQKDLADAFTETNGVLNDFSLDAVTAEIEDMRTSLDDVAATSPGWFDTLGAAIGDVASEMFEFRSASEATADELAEMANSAAIADFTKIRDEINALGLSGEELGRKLSQASAAQWVAGLREAGKISAETAQQLLMMRDTIERARDIDFNAAKVTKGLSEIAEKAGDASSDLESLKSVLEGLGLIEVTAPEAIADFNAEIDEIVESAKNGEDGLNEFSGAALDAAGKIDTTTEAGRNLQSALVGMADKLQGVATSGGDVDAVLANSERAFQSLADATGMPIEKIKQLAASYGFLPKEVRIAMSADGAGEVAADLANVALQLGKTPDSKSVEVELFGGDETARQLEDLGFQVEAIDGKEGFFTVTAETATARSALEAILLKASELELNPAQMKVFLDTAAFNFSFQDVFNLMNQLDAAQVTPEVRAEVQKALSDFKITQSELQALDALEASPEVKAIIAKALTDLATVNGKLDETGNKKPTPAVNLQDNASGGLDSIRAKLDAIQDKTVTVTVIEKAGASASGSANVGQWKGGVAGRWRGGVTPKLPGHSSGYRLPVTGPGTSIRDGFLGLTSAGMPIARVDAGEWIINGRSSKTFDPVLREINRGNAWAALRALQEHLGTDAVARAQAAVGSARERFSEARSAASSIHIGQLVTQNVPEGIRELERMQRRAARRYR